MMKWIFYYFVEFYHNELIKTAFTLSLLLIIRVYGFFYNNTLSSKLNYFKNYFINIYLT